VAAAIKLDQAEGAEAELDFGVEESLPELESVAPIWGLGKSVKVAEGPFGRGLFATRDIARGENIISVPLTACLVAEREEALYAPGASWEELTGGRVQGYERLQGFYEQYPLPWELRIALLLFDAYEGNASTLWNEYCELLPALDSLSVPLCLTTTPGLELEYINAEVRSFVQNQRDMLRTAFGDLVNEYSPDASAASDNESDEDEDVSFEEFLCHAVALVTSRAFQLQDGLFALVPLIDMANHVEQPTAIVAISATDLSPNMLKRASPQRPLTGEVQLVARKDISRGDEVTVSYGAELSSANLFSKYGFIQADGSSSDVVDVSGGARLPRPVVEHAMAAAVRERNGSWLRERISDRTLQAALASVCEDEANSGRASQTRATEETLALAQDMLADAQAVLGRYTAWEASVAAGRTDSVDSSDPGLDPRGEAIQAFNEQQRRIWERIVDILETVVKAN